jgi:hypothetical protein
VDAHTFTKQKFKQTAAISLLIGSAVGRIRAARDHNNVSSELQNTKKCCVVSFRAKGMEC